MDPSALPPPVVRAPADQVRATRDLERAALIGALIAGAVGWAIGGLLLHGVYASRPPDGFKTLSYLGSLFLVSWCAAYLGGLAGVVAGLIRSTDPQVRRPRVIAAMALFALVPTLLLAFAGLLLSPLGAP